jgi:hypothetical protein
LERCPETVETQPLPQPAKPQAKPQAKPNKFLNWFSQQTSTQPPPPRRDTLQSEIKAYEVMVSPLIDQDPLSWWKDHHHQLPLLSSFARIQLATPGSSAPAERLFSKMGIINSKKRLSLHPNQVEYQSFLAGNAHL